MYGSNSVGCRESTDNMARPVVRVTRPFNVTVRRARDPQEPAKDAVDEGGDFLAVLSIEASCHEEACFRALRCYFNDKPSGMLIIATASPRN